MNIEEYLEHTLDAHSFKSGIECTNTYREKIIDMPMSDYEECFGTSDMVEMNIDNFRKYDRYIEQKNSIHINDVVCLPASDIKGVVLSIQNGKCSVYTTEGMLFYPLMDKQLIKTGATIDVLNSVWTRNGD